MKKYKITVTENKRLLFEGEEFGSTEKQVKMKFKIKFPFAVIKAVRLTKLPGVQVTLEEMINDVMQEEGRLENE